jgi:hypothetical protein
MFQQHSLPSFNTKEQVVDDGFWWSGEMCRDKKEHQLRKHSARQTLTLKDES